VASDILGYFAAVLALSILLAVLCIAALVGIAGTGGPGRRGHALVGAFGAKRRTSTAGRCREPCQLEKWPWVRERVVKMPVPGCGSQRRAHASCENCSQAFEGAMPRMLHVVAFGPAAPVG